MIDTEWLDTLRFETIGGVRVTGLQGVGAEKVVLSAVTPDGEDVVVATRRHLLGYHIREIPPQIWPAATYDPAVVGRKLEQAVGTPGVDEWISGWDRLFSLLVKTIIEDGVGLAAMYPLASPQAFLLADSWSLLLSSSPIRRRLRELADLEQDTSEPIVSVNGANFRITAFRHQIVRDAKAALDGLPVTAESDRYIEDNPLFVWGGAAMEGFLDGDAASAAAVEHLREAHGALAASPDAARYIDEVDALANVFAHLFESEEDRLEVRRFAEFCARAGFVFQVRGKNGEEISPLRLDL